MAIDLKKRIGPLPLWAWVGTLALGGFLLWRNLNAERTTPTAQALSPFATPGFGLDPTTGAPFSGGAGTSTGDLGASNELMQAVTALIQGQTTIGEAIAGIPGQIVIPEIPMQDVSNGDMWGDLGMALDVVDRIRGAFPAGAGSAQQEATGTNASGRKTRRPAKRETRAQTIRRLRREARQRQRELETLPPGRRRNRVARRLRTIQGAIRRDRPGRRAPSSPGEQRSAAPPRRHRAPAKPRNRFPARRRPAAREPAQHGGPTRTRPAPTRHRGPVAQGRTAAMPPARSGPSRAAEAQRAREEAQRRRNAEERRRREEAQRARENARKRRQRGR
jgi:hypothetical protein